MWGGMHPTIRPDECLEHADYVCVGEGDKAVLDLIKAIESGQKEPQIKGIWYGTQKNGFGDLTENLDSIPTRDFSFEDQWLIENETGEYRELNRAAYIELCTPKYKDLQGKYQCYYRTSTSRGCPYHCTYCNNNIFHKNYLNHFRKRSIENVIDELESVKKNNPFIKMIQFIDDSFLSRNIDEIRLFQILYKEHIGIPFRIIAYPTSITKDKLDLLIDAGLCHISMGIESGSQTTIKKYERYMKTDSIIESAKLLNVYATNKEIEPPSYDIIYNNPFESEKERYETLNIMYQIPRPCTYSFYNLIPYPETKYYYQMKEAGLILNETNQIYKASYKSEPEDYPTILMFCLKWIPVWILKRMNEDNILNRTILYSFMKYKHKEGIVINRIKYANTLPKKILIQKIKNKIWRNKNGK